MSKLRNRHKKSVLLLQAIDGFNNDEDYWNCHSRRSTNLRKILIISSLLVLSLGLSAEESLKYGHEAGQFTQDYEAALEVAKAEGKAVFLNFTGSDWCGWCQLMAREVFSEEEWQEYAAENLVLVTLDFPNDSSIVPEEYVSRNFRLQSKYGVRGYPTYVLLASDGETELARLGASRNASPENFIPQVRRAIR
jgi:protein disulfide-isomerase